MEWLVAHLTLTECVISQRKVHVIEECLHGLSIDLKGILPTCKIIMMKCLFISH